MAFDMATSRLRTNPMAFDMATSRRKALIEESEMMERELRWIGILCDQLGQQELCETMPDIIQGLGEYILKHAKRRLAVECYLLGRALSSGDPEPETQGEWTRLRLLYPE